MKKFSVATCKIPISVYICTPDKGNVLLNKCESSSVGRAQPCQG